MFARSENKVIGIIKTIEEKEETRNTLAKNVILHLQQKET
jgi:hypothetical protein